MGRPIPGALLDDLTNRIDVVPRSGRGCHHVLPLRPGREHDLDWQKALCGARPRSGWSTAVPEDAQFCISCQQQLDVEAEVAEARVWTAGELFRSAQVAGVLSEEIRSGVFLPGHQFPSQAEVATRFGVSSSTTHRAWELLTAQGLIVAERYGGLGTYVTPHATRHTEPPRR